MWKHTGTLAVLLALIGTLSYSAEDGLAQTGSPERRPNILFVFSDDLDTYTLKRAMPKTEALIGDKGTIFPKALFAQPTCCPSRAAMQRGQYPHNTGVWDNVAPQGFQAFYENGLHKETYATVLDEAGYKTGYFGKYLNGYGGWTVPKKRADGTYDDTLAPLIPGWDKWRVSLGPPVSGVYKFEDGSIRNFERDTYGLPDRLATLWAERFIRGASASQGEHPFAAVVSLHAPHHPAEYPKREPYTTMFAKAQLPKPPSFDEADRSDKPKAVRNLSKIDAEEKRELTLYNRERLRSAAYADNLTARLLATLDESGELEDTLVVFWSDNGYHLGQHALESQRVGGKGKPYLEDVRVPLLIRGPGISAGITRTEWINGVDLLPTFADAADAPAPGFVDGRSFLPLARGEDVQWRGFGYSENPNPVRPWSALYTEGATYHRWGDTGEEELYDLSSDPYQLGNLLHDPTPEAEAKAAALAGRLDAMQGCAAHSCRTAEGQ